MKYSYIQAASPVDLEMFEAFHFLSVETFDVFSIKSPSVEISDLSQGVGIAVGARESGPGKGDLFLPEWWSEKLKHMAVLREGALEITKDEEERFDRMAKDMGFFL